MPDVEYRLTITSDSFSDGNASTPQKTTAQNNSGASSPDEAATKQRLTKGIRGMATYHIAKSVFEQVNNYAVSVVSLKSGSNRMQEQAAISYKVFSKVFNTAENVAVGFAMGNVVGAGIGLAVSAVQEGISIAQAQNTINLNRALENTSQQMTYIRAGANGSRHL